MLELLIKSDGINIYGNHCDNLINLQINQKCLSNTNIYIYKLDTYIIVDSAKDLTPQDLEMVLTVIKGIRKERGID